MLVNMRSALALAVWCGVIFAAILFASALGFTVATRRSPVTMAEAATKFLESLTPEQRQQATWPDKGAARCADKAHHPTWSRGCMNTK